MTEILSIALYIIFLCYMSQNIDKVLQAMTIYRTVFKIFKALLILSLDSTAVLIVSFSEVIVLLWHHRHEQGGNQNE
jgi:hypothetical protein